MRTPLAGSLTIAFVIGTPCFAGEPVHVSGLDDQAIRAAIEQLGPAGGEVQLPSGHYIIRRELSIPASVTLRGKGEVVFERPAPAVVTETGRVGDTKLIVSETQGFAPGEARLLERSPRCADETTRGPTVVIRSIRGNALYLESPLREAVAPGTRVIAEYPLLGVRNADEVTIDHITLDGGARPGVGISPEHAPPAILIEARCDPATGLAAPPLRAFVMSNCVVRDSYGPGVVLRNADGASVAHCRFIGVAGNAVELGHRSTRCTVTASSFQQGGAGVVIRGGSRHVVEGNVVAGCSTGIAVFRCGDCRQEPPAFGNIVERNTIDAGEAHAITIGPTCRDNTVRRNTVRGSVTIADPSTTVDGNHPMSQVVLN